MDISHIEGPEPVYRLAGKLSFADNEAMRPVLDDMGTGTGRTLILDISHLDYVDSFGIGLFLVALDEVKKAGNRLVVRNPQGAVKRIFALSNLDTLLTIEGENTPPLGPSAKLPPLAPVHNGLTIGPVVADGEGGFVVMLAGRFTFNDHEGFETLLSAIESCAAATLTLNLKGVEFMDSAGLSMLLIAREEAARNNTHLVLASPSGRVSQLLDLAAIDTLVDVREQR